MQKKTVFITGTTGSMGSAGLKILLDRKDRFNIVTLVRPSEKNKKLMRRYEGVPGLRIIWGDLTEENREQIWAITRRTAKAS